MIGLAVGFTYFGAFALGDSWGMSIQEIIDEYPFQFYLAMAGFTIILLQGEIQDQKEALREAEQEERARLRKEQEAKVPKPPPKSNKKKKRSKKK